MSADVRRYLDAAKSWRYEGTVDDVDRMMAERTRDGVEAGRIVPLGIGCDQCGFELAGETSFSLMSNPPCRWVSCGVCGYSTTQSSETNERY
jgi:hypothetical protein